MKKNTVQKICSVATSLLLVVSIFIMIFTIVSTRTVGEKNANYFLGYKPMIVNSDSMKGVFNAGDIIIVKKQEQKPEIGDIVTYYSIDPANYNGILSHRIIRTVGDGSFITKGDANDYEDLYPALEGNIIGTYDFRIPKAGYFFNFLKTLPGYLLCILAPFMLLIIMQVINFVDLLKTYRKEIKEKDDRKIEEMQKQIEILQNQLNAKEN